MPLPKSLKVGPHNEILKVPENDEFLKAMEDTPTLNPRQLLHVAQQYYTNQETRQIANHLAFLGMQQIVKEPAITKVIDKVREEQVPWSIFGNIWDAISDFFVPDMPSAGAHPVTCDVKCVPVFFFIGGGILVEQCTWSDGFKDEWHIVGACAL
jgi:hypothetical protein